MSDIGDSEPAQGAQGIGRLLRAAGFEAEVSLRPAPPSNERELTEKIEALFSFVDALPATSTWPA